MNRWPRRNQIIVTHIQEVRRRISEVQKALDPLAKQLSEYRWRENICVHNIKYAKTLIQQDGCVHVCAHHGRLRDSTASLRNIRAEIIRLETEIHPLRSKIVSMAMMCQFGQVEGL